MFYKLFGHKHLDKVGPCNLYKIQFFLSFISEIKLQYLRVIEMVITKVYNPILYPYSLNHGI